MKTDGIAERSDGVFYPGLVTARYYETWDFYTELLGFRTLEEMNGRVLLAHPSGARLEIILHETQDRFAELVSETDGRGFWLNLEVVDVDEEYRRLCRAGVQLVHPPENFSGGRRALTVRDPNGVLVCVANRREFVPVVCSGECVLDCA